MNKELIEKILQAAVRAPSGDNVQPWRFQVSEDFTKIALYNIPEKDDSYYNYGQAASFISHGAVLENILIAAGHLGVNAEFKLFPNESNPDLVANIGLIYAVPKPDPYYDAIFKRHTNRFPFRHTEVSESLMSRLNESVKNIDTVNIKLVNQKKQMNSLARIFMLNDRLVFERKDIHNFMFKMIRWNKKQIEETCDGMPVEVLGLNTMEKMFFPLLRHWYFVKTAGLIGLSRIIGLKCWWNCRNSSILGMISVSGNDDRLSLIQGGRGAQRLWLESTIQGLDLQPIVGLTLLIRRLNNKNLFKFTVNQEKNIEKAKYEMYKILDMKKNETPIMGFRIGKGLPLKVSTLRKIDLKHNS